MNRALSIALLVGGLVLLGFGINAANSVSGETSTALTGTPTDKALWLMIGGGVVALVGLVGLMRKPTALPH